MDSNQPRRIFLQRALTAAGLTLSASAISTILTSCETDEAAQPTPPSQGVLVKIADYHELTGAGTIAKAEIPGLNDGIRIFISQVEAEKFAVFSALCTHAGCIVDLPKNTLDCVCPCHQSRFSSTTGAVALGPAPSNLRAFASTFNAASGILTVQP